MKNSFLYQKYRKIAFALVLFIIGLIIFFSIAITVSSRRYLDRFVAHNTQMTQSYFAGFERDAVVRVSRWVICSNTMNAFREGDMEELNRIFDKRVETIGFPDVRILIHERERENYWYDGKRIPLSLLSAEESGMMKESRFRWLNNDLWFTVTDQIGEYYIQMALPIHQKNLEELSFYLEGNLLKAIEINNENRYVDRDFFHWQRLVFSVPIDKEEQTYLTYTFDMNSLAEYFYWSYGITTLSILLFFAWIMRYRLKRMILDAHYQIVHFEKEIKTISDGDYCRKIQDTGYHEFDRLGVAVNHLTNAIEERNLELSEHVQELYGLLIQVLEQKDPYTRGHSERVAKFAKGIAENLGIDNVDEIHAAGLLHDVGKVSIQEALLNKPGRFTDQEYKKIKEHAQKGHDLLMESKEFHRIRIWVLYHHERLDGSGYPKGLKGSEIPFESRIIAVADVFDAMTSDRSYRSALSIEETFEFLHFREGQYFEKIIVDALEKFIRASSEG